MIHRFSVRYTLIKPPEWPSKQASFANRFAALWYSVLQISPGQIPLPQLTHFSITANPVTSDSYLPISEHIYHLPHASHPVEKLMSIFMWKKLRTKVFMGAGVYYLHGKQGNISMDKMDECNLNKWKGSMNESLKKAKPHPQFRLEIAQREIFLKADGWHWRKILDTNFPPFQKETMQSAHCWRCFTPCRCQDALMVLSSTLSLNQAKAKTCLKSVSS